MPTRAPRRLLRYLEDQPDDFRALHILGRWYSRRGRFAEARDALARALQADPTDVFTHLYIGNLAYRERDWEVALIWFEFAALIAPDSPAPLWCQADVYEFQEKQDLAEEFFRRAVEVDPDDEQPRRLLMEWRRRRLWAQAREHEARGRRDLADGLLREALELDPDSELARQVMEEWEERRRDESAPADRRPPSHVQRGELRRVSHEPRADGQGTGD
ncbi:tetratricopeptide repeat protein [Planctomyces sp. SH-PL62]|uniref:tetratricopeptide repeat protein n=1 Tax=Planctomyces sp. SH-PL62 TaxID=1636152 RepID=UPI0012E6F1BF|nr:tetratricopeptide repeat protein [Planctomyces sp. SH-PL62]